MVKVSIGYLKYKCVFYTITIPGTCSERAQFFGGWGSKTACRGVQPSVNHHMCGIIQKYIHGAFLQHIIDGDRVKLQGDIAHEVQYWRPKHLDRKSV